MINYCLLVLAFYSTLLAEKPKILFDTDITGDVDDVLALAMCHTLAGRGACELLGVTISKNNPLTVSFVDAQNTFHGRPDLPIGVTRDPQAQHRESKYLKLADSAHYPHDLKRNEDAKEAVELIREMLATQPDNSVSIISVGICPESESRRGGLTLSPSTSLSSTNERTAKSSSVKSSQVHIHAHPEEVKLNRTNSEAPGGAPQHQGRV